MSLDLYQIITDIEFGKKIPKKYHQYFTDIKSILLSDSFYVIMIIYLILEFNIKVDFIYI